jgi:MYXO-CTERM domain-containing protein
MTSMRGFSFTCAVLHFLISGTAAHAATITDSTTFAGFSVTYDAAVWGPIRFAHEQDSFSGTLPVAQFGFGRFYFDPGFRVSSDGSAGPPEFRFRFRGQITIDAKPGWGLYYANFTQSGQWSTTGNGGVSVAGSVVDITAPNGEFFYDVQRAFTDPLVQGPDSASGYYYITRERSSFSKFDQLTIDLDILLEAFTPDGSGFARLASDVSDPSFLFGQGPYPNNNIVGTFLSIHYERVAIVDEPPGSVLLLGGLFALWLARRRSERSTESRETLR